MNLLFNTWRSNEHWDEHNYAIIELTPELARTILQRHSIFCMLKKSEFNLAEMEYHDIGAQFLRTLPESLEEPDYGEPYAETAFHANGLEAFHNRTECDRMVIDVNGVYWSAIAKHTDVRVETRQLDIDKVREVAGQ